MGPIELLMSQAARNEGKFRGWYGPMAQRMGIDQNPDAPEHHYDNRGFFQAMQQGRAVSPDKPGGHFPSEFKTEGHPRTFLDDGTGRIFDTRTARYLDGSPVPPAALRASESSPDMPGYVPGGTHGGMLEQESVFAPRRGMPPIPYREPQQAGPAPPVTGPIASMYGGRRG